MSIELNKIKRSMHHEIISSFWMMLGECETRADNDGDRLLKHQVMGWYHQWNRMTGDNKEPVWVRRLRDQAQAPDAVVQAPPEPKAPMSVDQIRELMTYIVSDMFGVPPDDVTDEQSFVADLGADSLDLVELVMMVEDQFGFEISDEDAEDIRAVGAAVRYVHGRLKP